jgi:hypothetical protein
MQRTIALSHCARLHLAKMATAVPEKAFAVPAYLQLFVLGSPQIDPTVAFGQRVVREEAA